MNAAADGLLRVVLSIPGLSEPPAGGGCCAVGREDVLLEEIDSWPGLLALNVDPEQGTAIVLVTAGHEEDLAAALDALSDRGLPATVLQTSPGRPSTPDARSAARSVRPGNAPPL